MIRALIFAPLVLAACPPPDPGPDDAGPPPGATLHVRKGGDGHGAITSNPDGVACDNDCADGADNTYSAGVTKVTLTATPARDALFDNWHCEGSKSGTPQTSTDTLSATFDAFDDPAPKGLDWTCTATFRQLWTILVITRGNGTGHIVGTAPSTDGAGTRIDCPTKCTAGYFNGDSETLTATPDADSIFVGWNFDCQGAGPATLTLDSDKNCEAHFCLATDPACP